MRVYISVDMEGIAGVVHESQTDPTTPAFAAEYGRFRRLMTAEANAAVEGALAAGATRVLVNDSHWFMRNLLAEELHQAAELVSGDPKPRSMVQGIEDGFDAARSEEHTSELQSLAYLVCRLLLEKKKKKNRANDCEMESKYSSAPCAARRRSAYQSL